MFRSLTARAIAASLIWIAVALGAGGWVILEVFHASLARQFDARLEAQLELLSASIAASAADPAARMTDPDFQRAYSGAYWQAERADGLFHRSRSLWDSILTVSPDGAEMERRDATGPDGEGIRLLTIRQRSPDQAEWTLAVAADKASLDQEFAQFQRTLWISAAILGAALLAAAILLLRAALLPLKELRRAVLARHSEHRGELTGRFPEELAPLVEDLNSLLRRNERLREKGRLQAANLAHALKTPAAILRNEIQKLRRDGNLNVVLAEQAVENLSATADRHLSLTAAAPEDMAFSERTDVVPVAREVVRAIGRLFPDIAFELSGKDQLLLEMSRTDQFELLGNLVENAAKWARGRVRLRFAGESGAVSLIVVDDGCGVPEESRARILVQGVRLDESRKGSGLGLTIVSDIVERYRGELDLSRSELGGLRVEVKLPHTL